MLRLIYIIHYLDISSTKIVITDEEPPLVIHYKKKWWEVVIVSLIDMTIVFVLIEIL